MPDPSKRTLAEKLGDRQLIAAAIQQAVREAVLMHARAGKPVCEWRDGKVVWVQPDEVLARFASVKSP